VVKVWVAEAWVAGHNGKAVKAQVSMTEEPDESVLDKLRNHVGVLFYLTYRVWPDVSAKPGTKVYQR
jgi:ABC-type arginine transport system ATPase subunit